MTTRERFVRTLTGKEVDRVPFIKVFGGDNATLPAWEKEHPGISNCIDKLLNFEGTYRGWGIAGVNTYLSKPRKIRVLEETDERRVEVRRFWKNLAEPKGQRFPQQCG